VDREVDGLLAVDFDLVDVSASDRVFFTSTTKALDKFSFHSEFIPVSNLADIEAHEMFQKVTYAHPESTVTLAKLWLDLLEDALTPRSRLIGPVSVPMEVSPGVAKLNQLVSFFGLLYF